jgi:hypothetical protein
MKKKIDSLKNVKIALDEIDKCPRDFEMRKTKLMMKTGEEKKRFPGVCTRRA